MADLSDKNFTVQFLRGVPVVEHKGAPLRWCKNARNMLICTQNTERRGYLFVTQFAAQNCTVQFAG